MTGNEELACYLKPYIQPFECILAIKELETLTGFTPIPETNSNGDVTVYRVTTSCSTAYLIDRLTYWERVEPSGNPLAHHLTRQVRREATADLIRNGITPEQLQARLPFQKVRIFGRA